VPAIRKLLIANRGEIVRRIRRTCSDMGIRTVSVYTSEERDAPHVVESDEAVLLEGTGPAAYLDVASLIAAATRSGADAVHPGYGFLAENAEFARAVTDAGLTWVGPPSEAIARMGDKLESKRVAREAGVPVLAPMDHSAVRLPALVKASAGGGGKGMRVVRPGEDLEAAIAAAQREAERAFGDGTVFVEPFLEKCRHVEIQVLGDSHGNLVHLGERECSIQRRHQKVIEEAPSSAVDADLRQRMGDAALSLAKAIDYRNAGTVEFLLDAEGRFFFMEMNTRLQVEHPVTEHVWTVDIVEQQLLDASGERLRVEVRDSPDGHSIEARLYAEDPANEFLPSTGVLVGWSQDVDPWVWTHSNVDEGSVITTSFDPLVAKVVVEAPTRSEAAKALALGLERMTIQGVTTNRDLLVAILRSESFLSGDTTTDFLERIELPARRELSVDEREAVLAAVVLHAEKDARAAARVLKTFPAGWRNSRMPPQRRILVLGEGEVTVEYERARDGAATVSGRFAHLGPETIEVAGRSVPVEVNRAGDTWWVHGPWGDVAVTERSPFPSTEIEEASGSLHAPMPGSVVSVEVSVGDAVRKGQTLVVLEAMKMEHPIGCPEDGVVSEVKVSAGDQVERGALLVVVEGAEK
jgi:propionyl-CoA carboxylase alpha chain